MYYDVADFEDSLDYVYANDNLDIGYGDADLADTIEFCLVPSLYEASKPILKAIFINFLYHIIRHFSRQSELLCNIISTSFGLILIHVFFNIWEVWPCLVLIILTHFIFLINTLTFTTFHIVTVFSCSVLISCEFLYPYPDTWIAIRGLMMIFTMKVISFAGDLCHAEKSINVNKTAVKNISLVQFLGYVLCPANLIMGPWFKYADYAALRQSKCRINLSYFLAIVRSLSFAAIFLTVSNCWSEYLFPDETNRLVLTYRKALTFRCSHYFVCFAAETTMLAAGFNNNNNNNNPNTKWSYIITKPLHIEWPRSLSTVVVSWNLPFHRFLKQYFYRDCLQTHGLPAAIACTYLISSLLHGLNTELSTVLFHLGLFSYVQVIFRHWLAARGAGTCVLARPCRGAGECPVHRYTNRHCAVALLNVLFSVETVAQLAYLGVLMDGDQVNRSVAGAVYDIYTKWADLYYVGHCLVLGGFICTLL